MAPVAARSRPSSPSSSSRSSPCPWFGHLGLPWPGGAATAEGSSGSPGATPTATVSGITIATDKERHDGKVLVRFTAEGGEPAVAQWRVDGGDWHTGKLAYVAAPKDHSRDGEHVMEVRAKDGGSTVKYTVRGGHRWRRT